MNTTNLPIYSTCFCCTSLQALEVTLDIGVSDTFDAICPLLYGPLPRLF